MYVVVTYDIEDDKRRTKLYKMLSGLGDHVQLSVFECVLDERKLKRLLERAEKLAIGETDSVRIYILCGHCLSRTIVLGAGPSAEEKEVFIV
jgi:CRISPR-associated protein Cas2